MCVLTGAPGQRASSDGYTRNPRLVVGRPGLTSRLDELFRDKELIKTVLWGENDG